MAVLIEGMEIPAEGYIDVRIKCNGTASFAIAKNPYFKEVEAVSVPEPHGRLGDLVSCMPLLKWLIQNRHSMTEATRVWIRGVLEGIAAAPTVIPASEEG